MGDINMTIKIAGGLALSGGELFASTTPAPPGISGLTMNPADKSSHVVLSGGNLTYTNTTGNFSSVRFLPNLLLLSIVEPMIDSALCIPGSQQLLPDLLPFGAVAECSLFVPCPPFEHNGAHRAGFCNADKRLYHGHGQGE